jgi:anti-sigma B factor antagonist
MSNQALLHATGTITGGVLVVTVVSTQIRDAAVAYALRDEIIALLDSSQPQDLVIDLRNVEFIGSIGFLAFLGVRRHLDGRRIVICNLSQSVREMFTITKLIATDETMVAPFESATTLEAALARLAG